MQNINGLILSLFVLIKLLAKLLKQTANKFSRLYKIYILKDEFTKDQSIKTKTLNKIFDNDLYQLNILK